MEMHETHGVRQGSLLGPFPFFCLSTNDFRVIVSNSHRLVDYSNSLYAKHSVSGMEVVVDNDSLKQDSNFLMVKKLPSKISKRQSLLFLNQKIVMLSFSVLFRAHARTISRLFLYSFLFRCNSVGISRLYFVCVGGIHGFWPAQV